MSKNRYHNLAFKLDETRRTVGLQDLIFPFFIFLEKQSTIHSLNVWLLINEYEKNEQINDNEF